MPLSLLNPNKSILLKTLFLLLILACYLLLAPPSQAAPAGVEDFFHLPEDLTEIASSYQVTCASAPTTQAFSNNANFLCKTFGICRKNFSVETNTETFFEDETVPWYSRNRGETAQFPSSQEKIKTSANQFFSFKNTNPQERSEANAPITKATPRSTQFLHIKEYLQTVEDWCTQFNIVTGNPISACPVPRHFQEIYPDDPLYINFPFQNELQFYQNSLKNLDYENVDSLPGNLQQAFWAIPPQIQDGVIFKSAYLLTYTQDPNTSFFTLVNGSQVNVIRFRFPAAVSEQANQISHVALGQKLPSSVNDYTPAYKDSALTKFAYSLQTKSTVDNQIKKNQERRIQQLKAVDTASFTGPAINFPVSGTSEDALLVSTLVRLINANGKTCTGPESTEIAKQINSQAEFGFEEPYLYQLVSNFIQSIFAIITPPPGNTTQQAPQFSYLILPEETFLGDQTSRQNILQALYPKKRWQKAQSQIPDLYQLLIDDSSSSTDVEEATDGGNYGLRTQTDKFQGDILGNITASITQIAGNILRLQKDKGSYQNSGCNLRDNSAECYWWETTTSTTPISQNYTCAQPYTPSKFPNPLPGRPAGDWTTHRNFVKTNYPIDTARGTSKLPNPDAVGCLMVYAQSYWTGSEFTEDKVNQVIAIAIQSGWNPSFLLSLWLEESHAGQTGGPPFGCGTSTTFAGNIACLTNTSGPLYNTPALYRDAFDFDDFLCQYAGAGPDDIKTYGPDACFAIQNTFVPNLMQFYNIITQP